MYKHLLTLLCTICIATSYGQLVSKPISLLKGAKILKGKKILYIEREQYASDHHNTATLFQHGEINQSSFAPGAAMKIFDVDTRKNKVVLETPTGVIRDPEMSFDGQYILFSMREKIEEGYHIYEIDIEGENLKQLTFAKGVSDIDPLYLPDGGIVFSSTREPKYCMCNRHIMANLFRMNGDGSNITQLGVSTLFEGHAALLNDGRILYDRWEYVDRNFGDAQGLWVVNPDGTKHAIYYGNNTASPGGVIDARAIPNSDQVVCIFGSCHDKAWGAMAIIDRNKGVDGKEPLVQIWPKHSEKWVGNGNLDTFKNLDVFYEDPYPLGNGYFLVSRSIWLKDGGWNIVDEKMGIYLVGVDGTEELLFEGNLSLFDPMPVEPRFKPAVIPSMRNYTDAHGTFYVQDVYEGTHMEGVELGSVKYLRIIESPAKKSWTVGGWGGEGEQAPGVNWHSFETKKVLGIVPVESDGSASFEAPAGLHVYFQVLDKDMKMIQTMRSGVSLMPGETNGCIGCHEDRLSIPVTRGTPMALKNPAHKLSEWMEKKPVNFSFMEHVQPILDKRCVKCHDFDAENRDKLVLAADKNPYFNAAYVNMYVKKIVSLIGGGPASLQPAYTWGSHKSKLTEIIDGNHKGVQLSQKEKRTLYTWMDINGVYYPIYETAFDNTMAGRCPLTYEEMGELGKLTATNWGSLNNFRRNLTAQVSFDRPEKSPCLDQIRDDKASCKRALELITLGRKRLKETPRGDVEKDLVMCERNRKQIENYVNRLKGDVQNSCRIDVETKKYDLKE